MISADEFSGNFNSVTAYINAGGRGTRLNNTFTPDPEFGIAKGLLEVGEPPLKLVDHHINHLSEVAFRNIVIGAGDLRSVKEYVDIAHADTENVSAVDTSQYEQLGTAGDLIVSLRTKPELFGKYVLINNVDTILDLNLGEFVQMHLAKYAAISIALTTLDGVPNYNAFHVSTDGKVLYSSETTENTRTKTEAQSVAKYQASSTGALVIDTDFLKNLPWYPNQGQLSLYRHVMSSALALDSVNAYNNRENFFVDIGTDVTWRRYAQSSDLQRLLCYDTIKKNEHLEETIS